MELQKKIIMNRSKSKFLSSKSLLLEILMLEKQPSSINISAQNTVEPTLQQLVYKINT
jgi:hypothetical protein